MKKVTFKCGCGQHMVSTDDKNTIRWQGGFWNAVCAFNHAEMANISRTKVISRRLAETPCPMCKLPVGRRFEFFGSEIYCHSCLHEIGGEG